MCDPNYGRLSSAKIDNTPPEELLARVFKDDLNVEINPMAFRMFIRSRWDRISTLAHRIHDGA